VQITGGFLKGRKIYCPPSKALIIRPLRTRIRKAIFDILGQVLPPIKVLDLFAGTGAVGIEAISRGAKFAVFVDLSPLSIELIKKNIEKFKLEDRTAIFQMKLPKDLPKLAGKLKEPFDLIFITPPYAKKLALKTLENMPESLLKKDTLIIAEERSDIELPEEVFIFKKIDKREYGETTLHFYKLKES